MFLAMGNVVLLHIPMIGGGSGLLFTVTYGVIAVHTALPILIQTSQDVGDVVGEEPLVVQHGCRHLCHCWGAHRLVMSVAVCLQAHFSNLYWDCRVRFYHTADLVYLAECENVTPAPSGSKHGLVRELEQLGLVPGQDGVPGGGGGAVMSVLGES